MARGDDNQTLEDMVNVLVAAGPFAYGHDDSILDTARDWLGLGFGPGVAHEWLTLARCYEPQVAKDLTTSGIDPDMAGAKVNGKALGFLVASGEMTLEEARDRTAPLRAKQEW